MMKLLTVLLFLLSGYLGFGQDYSLKDFVACDTPAVFSEDWSAFNRATDKQFVFSLESGRVKISKYRPAPVCEYVLPAGGQLIGVNGGEFGGGLYYRPIDTAGAIFINSKNIRELKYRRMDKTMVPEDHPLHATLRDTWLLQRGNVQAIFSFNDSIYYMGGLAHMGLYSGGISRLKFQNDSFFIAGALNIGDAPTALAIHEGLIYVACSKGFYVIDKHLQIKLAFKNLFWDGLYPTSVLVVDKRTVLVAIRGGYINIDPEARSIQLYKAK